ncbi:argininosuccinate lyase [Bradyrhizobium sp. GCM10027634]|uniref:argininosuccinate lyase n=1 Tax=unclassified Bradyrhizobium TaxID=2631580 RepID=UPI00188A5030|nr:MULTISPECIES: argininosuccinate lyase [unclassified Bradyrhizobium]MDN5004049.1 argininosuccinate lyase [Bradyrhizobium sp. WYCCWR 12677]QOZ44950.1 argininosuccinate lyase [Bradyrhizobium sp. CCBAU 53340]
MRERVKLPPSKVVVDYLIRPRLDAGSYASFEPIMDLNRAHVVMLAARSIIKQETARTLIRVLEDVRAAGPAEVTWDPALEEAYYNLEAHIIKKAGPAIGGQMHTGRSRNDLGAALTRMSARSQLLSLATLLHSLREELLLLAETHASTIVTGYTHMQPAQPTTLGHYFHAVAHALERDELRLQQSYEVVNRCPLGACAFNTTGFPIDRQMLAELTGFSGLVENSIDAVASRDYIPQILVALAILAVNLSRLAQDLYTWGTDEFGWLEIGDEVATTSSIMPQKKNPITLEHIRSKSSHLIGATTAALAAQKGVPYGHLRDISLESVHPLREGLKEAEAVLSLTTATLRSLEIKGNVADKRAAENFSTVTELADVMVRETEISFREAHIVVGSAVSELYARGAPPTDLTIQLLDRIAEARFGHPSGLSENSLRQALSPAANVAIRRVRGGPAPSEVLRSIEASRKRFTTQQTWWDEQKASLEAAQRRLDAAAASLAAT